VHISLTYLLTYLLTSLTYTLFIIYFPYLFTYLSYFDYMITIGEAANITSLITFSPLTCILALTLYLSVASGEVGYMLTSYCELACFNPFVPGVLFMDTAKHAEFNK